MIRRTSLLAVAACMLAAAPTASAHPTKRGFERSYPHATHLCAQVAAGKTPERLASSTAQVAAACATLKASFTAAQTAYTTAVTPLKQQADEALAALKTTCQQARAGHDRGKHRGRGAHDNGVCREAKRATWTKLKALRAQQRAAAKTYHQAVNTARKTFWTTIKGLKGGATVPPDKPVHLAPHSGSLPSESDVAKA